MKTKITLLSFFLLISTIIQAQTWDVITEEYQITSSSAYETTPTLGNDGTSDLVVFTVRPDVGGAGDIWYQRLVDGAPSGIPVQVTSAATDDELNDIWGDYITYTAYDNLGSTSGTIMLYQISTGTVHSIGNASIMQEPHIHDHYVVWREGGAFSAQIMLYDLDWLGTSLNPIIIAGPVPPTFQVQLADRFVVWTEWDGQYDVHIRDLDDATTFAITNTPLMDESTPATEGAWVVWSAQEHGATSTSIIAMNVDTWQAQVIVDNGAYNLNPSISGDLIVWESTINGNMDIYAYRISSGETFQITTQISDQYLNDVLGNLIVYADNRNGAADIYVSRLSFINNMTVNIPDPNFEQALIDLGIDSDGIINQQILKSDAEGITTLDVSDPENNANLPNVIAKIDDLTGIEAFVNLTSLDFRFNQLTSIDLSQNSALFSLMCAGNQLTELDVLQNTELSYILCANNQLNELDVSQNTNLKYLFCSDNNLSALDVSTNTSLSQLSCGVNQIAVLDVSNNTALTKLSCHSNQLTVLDVTSNILITNLICENNQLTEIDISQNTDLQYLNCGKNQLTNLDVSSNTSLQELDCYYNQITNLDVSQNHSLTKMLAFVNDLTEMDMRNGNNINITSFNASNNNLGCINVDDETADHSSWIIDQDVVLSNDCSNNTQPGDQVLVTLSQDLLTTVQYESVTESGSTTMETSEFGSEIPDNFAFGDPMNYFNIETTASFIGVIQVAIYFGDMSYINEDELRIIHYETDLWVDVTTSVDLVSKTIYGEVFSLSPFVVVEFINTPPIVDNIIAPVDPIALGNEAIVTVEFTDDNLSDAFIDWGDGSGFVSGTISGNTATWVYTYPFAGVYAVRVKLIDTADEEVEETYQYIVVYDPFGGFVTGGGWINSPLGAYTVNPLLEGKANFGFVAKYKKGQTVPTGNTEFQFKAGDLNFNSSLFDWLIIAGSKAKFKGEGTINGTGSFGFMISAIDEDSKDKTDKFRIKIWDKENEELIVYDNQLGEEDNSDPTTEIAGGAIVVHSESKKTPDPVTTLSDDIKFSEINIYPNPFSNSVLIDLQFMESKRMTIEVYDLYGKLIEKLYYGNIEKDLNYNFEFKPRANLKNGIYIVKFVMDNGSVHTKKLMLER